MGQRELFLRPSSPWEAILPQGLERSHFLGGRGEGHGRSRRGSIPHVSNHCFAHFYFFNFIYLFLERGEGKEKERERNINVWLHLMSPLLGTWLATQACALTGNWTGDLSVHKQELNPHQPGLIFHIFNIGLLVWFLKTQLCISSFLN